MSNVTNPHSVLLEDSSSGKPTAQKSTNSAAHAHITASDIVDPLLLTADEVVYSATTGNGSVLSDYEDYTRHAWQVEGADADDDVSITISLDGTNFYALAVVRTGNGETTTPVTVIENDGIYVPALSLSTPGIIFKHQQITRVTAAGSNAIVVRYLGRV